MQLSQVTPRHQGDPLIYYQRHAQCGVVVAAVPELVSTILGRICWSEAGGFPTFFPLSGRAFSKTKVGSCPIILVHCICLPAKSASCACGLKFWHATLLPGLATSKPLHRRVHRKRQWTVRGARDGHAASAPGAQAKVTLATQVLQVRAWAHALIGSTEFSVVLCLYSQPEGRSHDQGD